MTLEPATLTALAWGFVGSVFASYALVRAWVFAKNLIR